MTYFQYLKAVSVDCLKAWGRLPEVLIDLWSAIKGFLYYVAQLLVHIILPVFPPFWFLLAWVVKKYDERAEAVRKETLQDLRTSYGRRHQKL